MVAIYAPLGFPENHIPNKSFQIIAVLPNDVEINRIGIRMECLPTFFAFRIGMDVVLVKKTHYGKIVPAQDFYRIN